MRRRYLLNTPCVIIGGCQWEIYVRWTYCINSLYAGIKCTGKVTENHESPDRQPAIVSLTLLGPLYIPI